jgi:hypothetical protein
MFLLVWLFSDTTCVSDWEEWFLHKHYTSASPSASSQSARSISHQMLRSCTRAQTCTGGSGVASANMWVLSAAVYMSGCTDSRKNSTQGQHCFLLCASCSSAQSTRGAFCLILLVPTAWRNSARTIVVAVAWSAEKEIWRAEIWTKQEQCVKFHYNVGRCNLMGIPSQTVNSLWTIITIYQWFVINYRGKCQNAWRYHAIKLPAAVHVMLLPVLVVLLR